MRAVPTWHVQSLNEGCEVCTVFMGTAAVSWQAGEERQQRANGSTCCSYDNVFPEQGMTDLWLHV